LALQQIISGYGFYLDWWESYTIRDKPGNLGPEAVRQKCQLFFVYHAVSLAESMLKTPYNEFEKPWRRDYEKWFTKSYPVVSYDD
jgi:hypothetical protein